MNELSVKDCVRFGWERFKARPWIFISATLLLFLIGALLNLPQTAAKQMTGMEGALLSIVAFIITTLFSFLLSMGKTSFYLKAHEDVESIRLTDLWHPHPFGTFLVASILAGLATIIGLVLLIVPGIIIGIIVGFTSYIVVDRELGPIEAIKESARITKGNRWNILLLGAALLGINILGFCALGIGLLVSMPISALAIVHAYRMLSHLSSEVVPVSQSA